MFQVNNSTNKSFTLIEIIIAIFVITIGVLAAYAGTQQIVSYTYQASSRLTAAYLAKEGIEIVRNIRDTNWLDPADPLWNKGITAISDYQLDYQSLEFPDLNCSLGPDKYLKYDGSFYNCSSGSETKFTRKITIDNSVADILKVSVEVRWTEKGATYGPITVQENLYNWAPPL